VCMCSDSLSRAPAYTPFPSLSLRTRAPSISLSLSLSLSLNPVTRSQAAEGKELNVYQKSKIETIPRMEAEVAGLEKTLAAMS